MRQVVLLEMKNKLKIDGWFLIEQNIKPKYPNVEHYLTCSPPNRKLLSEDNIFPQLDIVNNVDDYHNAQKSEKTTHDEADC